jgi:threonine/homoserine/homoserine lactone efflux protein
MMLTQVHATFFLAAVLLALTPGPDNLFVLLHSAQHGARSGLLVVLGLCTGLLGHTAAVALGLAALLAASTWAWWFIKSAGCAYLLRLAWLSWRAPAAVADTGDTPALSARSSYRRGVWMNLSNPKVAVFFLAFLPQFVQTESMLPAWQQILLLGGLFMLATLLVFGGMALGAGRFGQRWLSSPRKQAWLNRLAALLFCALAVRLWLV